MKDYTRDQQRHNIIVSWWRAARHFHLNRVIVLKEEVTAKIDVCTLGSCGAHVVFSENAPV